MERVRGEFDARDHTVTWWRLFQPLSLFLYFSGSFFLDKRRVGPGRAGPGRARPFSTRVLCREEDGRYATPFRPLEILLASIELASL